MICTEKRDSSPVYYMFLLQALMVMFDFYLFICIFFFFSLTLRDAQADRKVVLQTQQVLWIVVLQLSNWFQLPQTLGLENVSGWTPEIFCMGATFAVWAQDPFLVTVSSNIIVYYSPDIRACIKKSCWWGNLCCWYTFSLFHCFCVSLCGNNLKYLMMFLFWKPQTHRDKPIEYQELALSGCFLCVFGYTLF